MATHALVHDPEDRRPRAGRLLQLGWPHFWLLSGILAALVSLVGLVLFAPL